MGVDGLEKCFERQKEEAMLMDVIGVEGKGHVKEALIGNAVS